MPKKPSDSNNENPLKAALSAAPPEHKPHGEDSWEHPISEKMVRAKCWNWHMEGNMLYCDTDFGPLGQVMPTNIICLGEKDGLPILKEL